MQKKEREREKKKERTKRNVGLSEIHLNTSTTEKYCNKCEGKMKRQKVKTDRRLAT